MIEYIWYIIAALGAGVGTGLAGLSAATVMVPILIVLCPSFSNDVGVYQATAIALASDILGSAITSYVYYKHKNIDLKRGWLMFVCIITMCVAGSIAAWKAGNFVLGNFTLFLTFCIGVRFLIKPDTERKETVDMGAKLDLKGIIISLFFGVTIGFGAGFVGSGGGMMMLVVFTAFLGMNLKSAVGTSTFIMTFTALIASVSHILVEPSIVLERWDALIICIVVATLASLVSARFANKVNNRVVGLVTGLLLTVLGAIMLVLNYWSVLSTYEVVLDIISCICDYLGYLIVFIVVLLFARFVLNVKGELFRKSLHVVAYTSTLCMYYVASNWQVAALSCIIFAIVVYPFLHVAECWEGFSDLLTERKPGEIKKSLLLLFITDGILIAIAGYFELSYAVVAAILMWGTGDTSAALIGKRYGKHKVNLPLADHKKSYEGTFAMLMTSFIVGVIILKVMSNYSFGVIIINSLIGAAVGAYVELISHNGNDTVYVPSAIMVVLVGLSYIF